MPKTSAQTIKTLDKKIQKLREERGQSQGEFAHQLGISRVHMGFIEQGRENPSLKLLMKISRKFGVQVEDLFRR